MIQLIIGEKGKGKTKILLDMANKQIKSVNGNIVYLDKSKQHMYELNNRIRLIDVKNYPVDGRDTFLGFLCGIISQDNDLELMYLDSFLTLTRINADEVEDALTALTETIADDYVEKSSLDTLATKDELTASTVGFATEEWVNNQGFLKEHQSLDNYATRDELEGALTALTETIADEYIEKSELDTLATKDELTASTVGFATEEWVNNQGFLKEHQSLENYATLDDLTSSSTQSVNAAIAGSTAWTENQGFAYEEDVRDTIADVLEIISTASTAANSYADSVGSTALTSAKSYTDSVVNDAITGITHPAYVIESTNPSSADYQATYRLMKDGSAVTGSALINIPKVTGGSLQTDLTTDIAVGHVSAGTTFTAGTTIEEVLRAIFVGSGVVPPANASYFYYGSVPEEPYAFWDVETITPEAVTTYLTRSQNEASAGTFSFNTTDGDTAILVVIPNSLRLVSITNGQGGNEIYGFDMQTTVTINNVVYNAYCYYAESGIWISGSRLTITTENA